MPPWTRVTRTANNAWRAGRLEAGRKAAQKARAKSETRLPAGLIGSDGAVQGAAMEAAHDAMVDYEKRVKRPIWKHSGKPTAVFELIPNWGT
jgi:hypothetical protein